MKYIVILTVSLAVTAFFLYSRVITLEKDKTSLESEKTALMTTIERYKNAQVESNKTIKKLREISKTNKESSDWYDNSIPDDYIKFLQERHNRSRR